MNVSWLTVKSAALFAILMSSAVVAIFSILGISQFLRSITISVNNQQEDFRKNRPSNFLNDIATVQLSNNSAYAPSWLEDEIFSQARGSNLHYDWENATACTIWNDPNVMPNLHGPLQTYLTQLQEYETRLKAFDGSGVHDLRQHILQSSTFPDSTHAICDKLELHPLGLNGIFRIPATQADRVDSATSGLSWTSGAGYVEPLLPPMRHPYFCKVEPPFRGEYILNMKYLVHDFAHMCRLLKPTSRIVFFDLGASLTFHNSTRFAPALYVMDLFQRFGFRFDHIYAYEKKEASAQLVYSILPRELEASYHWINAGIETPRNGTLNPLRMVLENFNKDDLVVMKLDIDTSWIELPLAKQLLEDDRLADLVDVFYFEHHVHFKEMTPAWRGTQEGTLYESMKLFQDLRKKGIASHSWV